MFSGFYLALLLVLVLPDRPRRLVRVADEERETRAGARSGRGRTRSAASARRSSGASGSRPCSTARRSTSSGDFTGSFWDLFSIYTVVAGLAVVLLFAFHGATYLTLRTTGDLLARAAEATRMLSIPAAIAGAAFLVSTVFVAIDRNDKSVFPPVLPAALGIAALLLAARLRCAAPDGPRVRDDRARRDPRRRDALHEPLPARDGVEHATSPTA